jgi:energy-coupling factor transporter ATP-binding protein EcfA2
MIEAHGLVKRYGSTMAVNDLSFSIRPGVVTGFLGPNGAGKTTTMRMIRVTTAPVFGACRRMTADSDPLVLAGPVEAMACCSAFGTKKQSRRPGPGTDPRGPGNVPEAEGPVVRLTPGASQGVRLIMNPTQGAR